MLNIPYVKMQPKGCALACYTMVANYFFPEVTENEIKTISRAEPGYIVWGYPFWLWIIDKGIKITLYDTLDLKNWAEKGISGLKQSVPEKEFNFYLNGTKDLNAYSEDLKKLLGNENFKYVKTKPSFEDLQNHFNKGDVCEVVLDAKTLNQKEGFSLHRVVILDVNDDFVIMHDPSIEPTDLHIKRKVDKKLFIKSWLEVVEEPALCCYSR